MMFAAPAYGGTGASGLPGGGWYSRHEIGMHTQNGIVGFDEAALVDRARGGDDSAFAGLVNHYERTV